jgi:Flp pilus assembly pilin Flp
MNAVGRVTALRSLGQRGSTAVEYALLIALIAAAITAAAYFVGVSLTPVFSTVANTTATSGPAPPVPAQGTVEPPGPHYEDCDAVRAAGAAPIRAGDPGYSVELDPDGDGVGCE